MSGSAIRDVRDTLVYHWKEGNYDFEFIIYVAFMHVAAVYGCFKAFDCQWQTLALAAILWPISGLGITAGAHRLWTHRSYKAKTPYRILLMLFMSVASQRDIYSWAREHRAHHKHSDTEADPYNATRGFFYCHMGWLLLKKSPKVLAAEAAIDMSDLEKDPVVMFQYYLPPFPHIMSFVVPPLIAHYCWGETFLNGFLIPGALRWVIVLHITFTVNSLCHMFGERPYDANILPTENWWVSIFALGEGWHNWHHKYPYDYAAGEHGIDKQANVTKAWIDMFAAVGQVWDRKRFTKNTVEGQTNGGTVKKAQ